MYRRESGKIVDSLTSPTHHPPIPFLFARSAMANLYRQNMPEKRPPDDSDNEDERQHKWWGFLQDSTRKYDDINALQSTDTSQEDLAKNPSDRPQSSNTSWACDWVLYPSLLQMRQSNILLQCSHFPTSYTFYPLEMCSDMSRCFSGSFKNWFLPTWSNAWITNIELLVFILLHCLFFLQCWNWLVFCGAWRSSYTRENVLPHAHPLYSCYSLFIQRIKLLWYGVMAHPFYCELTQIGWKLFQSTEFSAGVWIAYSVDIYTAALRTNQDLSNWPYSIRTL